MELRQLLPDPRSLLLAHTCRSARGTYFAYSRLFRQLAHHLTRVICLGEQIELPLGGTRAARHRDAMREVVFAPKFIGRVRKHLHQALHGARQWPDAIGIRIDEIGLIAKSGGPPFVLLDHHRVAIVLVRAVVDLVRKRLHQALHQGGQRERIGQIRPACRTRAPRRCRSYGAAAHPTRFRESC